MVKNRVLLVRWAITIAILAVIALITWFEPKSYVMRAIDLRAFEDASPLQQEITAHRFWKVIDDTEIDLIRMCGSKQDKLRLLGVKGLDIQAGWSPVIVLGLLADKDYNVRDSAISFVDSRSNNAFHYTAKLVLMSMLYESVEDDPQLMDKKARTVNRMTWGRFAYIPGESVNETRLRAKAFLTTAKSELEE